MAWLSPTLPTEGSTPASANAAAPALGEREETSNIAVSFTTHERFLLSAVREAGTIHGLSRILARAPWLHPTEEGGFADDIWTARSSPARHRSRVGRVGRPRPGGFHLLR